MDWRGGGDFSWWLGEGELKNKNGVEGAWDELRRACVKPSWKVSLFSRSAAREKGKKSKVHVCVEP